MRAWIFHAPGDLRLEDVEPSVPGPGEVAVEIRAAATCGTDLKSYRRGHPTLFPSLPARFGHEFAGVVTEVGDGVTTFAPGQRVVAANTCPCGSCWACTIGRESLCENLQYLNGAFAEQIVIPRAIVERNTYAIPDTLPFEAAAPLEPLATVVHGMSESGIALGDTVVVNGAGPIGQMYIRLAQLRGASVIAADMSPGRLAQASEAGAIATVDLTGVETVADKAELIRAATPHGRAREEVGDQGAVVLGVHVVPPDTVRIPVNILEGILTNVKARRATGPQAAHRPGRPGEPGPAGRHGAGGPARGLRHGEALPQRGLRFPVPRGPAHRRPGPARGDHSAVNG
jgi:threonine dehydrogenase-like Zn-dependent dehydrogenase